MEACQEWKRKPHWVSQRESSQGKSREKAQERVEGRWVILGYVRQMGSREQKQKDPERRNRRAGTHRW